MSVAARRPAPSFGVAICDFDGDGRPDIVLAQNFYPTQIETGRMSGSLGLLLRNKGNLEFEPVWPLESGISVPGDARALSVCDLDGDGWPDLVFTTNDGPLRVYRNQGCAGRHMFQVKLTGPAGNPTQAGARVTLTVPGLLRQTQELHAGGGYLSQSSSTLFFGLDKAIAPEKIEVHWADGTTRTFEDSKFGDGRATIKRNY